ncbi:MAG TPA: hypothetical protein VH682_01425 [Gemmataceae bacterium]|jgi:hypothetical protein
MELLAFLGEETFMVRAIQVGREPEAAALLFSLVVATFRVKELSLSFVSYAFVVANACGSANIMPLRRAGRPTALPVFDSFSPNSFA